jgi:hypothetical protein
MKSSVRNGGRGGEGSYSSGDGYYTGQILYDQRYKRKGEREKAE